MAVKKSKFQKHLELGHKEIKGKRATIMFEQARDCSEEFVRDLKKKKRQLEHDLLDLEDFHVNQTTSLKVTGDSFRPQTWIEELNKTKVNLKLMQVKLDVSEEIHKEWFDETVE